VQKRLESKLLHREAINVSSCRHSDGAVRDEETGIQNFDSMMEELTLEELQQIDNVRLPAIVAEKALAEEKVAEAVNAAEKVLGEEKVAEAVNAAERALTEAANLGQKVLTEEGVVEAATAVADVFSNF